MIRSTFPVALAVLVGALMVEHPVEAKPGALHARAADSKCNELGQILFAALGDYALRTDKISLKKPEVPGFPKGPPGESRLVPIQRNTPEVWHSGWKGRPPAEALVSRWFEAPVSSVSSCLQARADGDVPFGRVFPNWSDNNVSLAQRSRSYSWTFRVSEPVLDKRGTHALVFYEMYRPGLGGGTEFVHIQRTSSGWRKIGERLLSNS